MPSSAPKACPQCGRAGCEEHRRTPWVQTASYTRTRGRRLQQQRAELFRREPLCRECSRAGRVELATIRDHIKPLAEGGSDDDSNVQPLCGPCSDAKTAAEAQRGRVRDRWAGYRQR